MGSIISQGLSDSFLETLLNWQTSISLIASSLIGGLSAYLIYAQIRTNSEINEQKRVSEEERCKATLPPALSSIVDYASTQIYIFSQKTEVSEQYGEKNHTVPLSTPLPQLDETKIITLEDCIGKCPQRWGVKLHRLLRAIQVQETRLREIKTKNTSFLEIKRQDFLNTAVEIRARANTLQWYSDQGVIKNSLYEDLTLKEMSGALTLSATYLTAQDMSLLENRLMRIYK
tara:strand:+ start:1988 stop:2677 length:690 start_codon:yes stop_codon:yes gene_type:complete